MEAGLGGGDGVTVGRATVGIGVGGNGVAVLVGIDVAVGCGVGELRCGPHAANVIPIAMRTTGDIFMRGRLLDSASPDAQNDSSIFDLSFLRSQRHLT